MNAITWSERTGLHLMTGCFEASVSQFRPESPFLCSQLSVSSLAPTPYARALSSALGLISLSPVTTRSLSSRAAIARLLRQSISLPPCNADRLMKVSPSPWLTLRFLSDSMVSSPWPLPQLALYIDFVVGHNQRVGIDECYYLERKYRVTLKESI